MTFKLYDLKSMEKCLTPLLCSVPRHLYTIYMMSAQFQWNNCTVFMDWYKLIPVFNELLIPAFAKATRQ